MGLDPFVVLVVGVAILFGSLVQGSAGFGVSLLGAPVMMFLDPSLMPGSMLIVGCVLPLFTLIREGRHVDWRMTRWMLLGRLGGTAAGVWVLAALSPRALAIGLGFFLVVAIGLSVRNVVLPTTTPTLLGAGLLTGVTGTAVSVSGPVVGVVLQYLPGAALRATMAAFFSIGTAFSLTGLAIGGALTGHQIATGLAMVPFLTAGYLLSGPLRRYLDTGWTRPAVLAICLFAAISVLLKGILLP